MSPKKNFGQSYRDASNPSINSCLKLYTDTRLQATIILPKNIKSLKLKNPSEKKKKCLLKKKI